MVRQCQLQLSALPRHATDLRTEAKLNESERIQTPYLWLTDPTCQGQFKSFLTTLVTRKNTINGRVYKDDPVILVREGGGEMGGGGGGGEGGRSPHQSLPLPAAARAGTS